MHRNIVLSLIVCILLSIGFVSSVRAAPARADRGAWAPNVAYAVNDTVTYAGATYKCLQAHTSLVGWEPSTTPALWQLVSGTLPTATATAKPASGPAGYTFCANENGTCSFSGTASVAYGANGLFNYKTATTSIACNNATFGDPISGTAKACYYQTVNTNAWTACAGENGTCSFSGTQQVRFGSGNFYSTRTVAGSIVCNNTAFGDPNFGVAKSCDVRPTAGTGAFSSSGWTQCATENGTCAVTGQVIYGGNGWFSQRNSTGSIACTNATFGDPVPGTAKVCYYKPASTINYNAAPYVMPRDNTPPDIAAVMSASGVKVFTLAFILANGSSCSPAWDGNDPIGTDTAVQAYINTIRANGGDVVPSVGGYGGTKLGMVCADGPSTYNAYQQVVSKYNIKAIDFDIEEPEIENAAAVARELYAAKQFVSQGLNVSITMPVTTTGLNYFAMCSVNNSGSVLSWAQANNFTPTSWNVMPFDAGMAAPMGTSTVNIAEIFHGQLKTCFGWDDATAYAHSGLSLMNGRSDTGEYTLQSDFTTIINYAKSHALKRLTYWSVNRDRSCLAAYGSTDPGTKGDCSSVTQNPWDFTKLFAGF